MVARRSGAKIRGLGRRRVEEVAVLDPLGPWEITIIIAGLRILSILTFLAFGAWVVWHLIKLFRSKLL